MVPKGLDVHSPKSSDFWTSKEKCKEPQQGSDMESGKTIVLSSLKKEKKDINLILVSFFIPKTYFQGPR